MSDDFHALGNGAQEVGGEIGVGCKERLDFPVNIRAKGQVLDLTVTWHQSGLHVVIVGGIGFQVTARIGLRDNAGFHLGPSPSEGPTFVDQRREVRGGRKVSFGSQNLEAGRYRLLLLGLCTKKYISHHFCFFSNIEN